jgi:hypothetical protein
MLADDDLGAVDLDHCHDPKTGAIDAWAQKEIDAANGAYVEVTVSSRGLRILGVVAGGELGRKWKIPNTTTGATIEVYTRTNRYVRIRGAQKSGGAELPHMPWCSMTSPGGSTPKPQTPKPATLSSSSSRRLRRQATRSSRREGAAERCAVRCSAV